jgi:hypothetical protein
MELAFDRTVALTEVGTTRELRIDSHFHLLSAKVSPLVHGVRKGCFINRPTFATVENGKNIPRQAYDITLDDPEFLYVSVGSLSQFAIQLDAAVPLKSPKVFVYDFSLSESAFKRTEVLLTRSGTPGIAWADRNNGNDPKIIPSGFVIRIDCDKSGFDPVYLAAILDHPAWRVWSSGLAAGKRQRNISQEHLAQIRIPLLTKALQDRIAAQHDQCLRTITEILQEEVNLRTVADEVLASCGIEVAKLSLADLTFDKVSLAQCARSSTLRIDARFHRSDLQSTLINLQGRDCVSLESLLLEDLCKNSQPTILPVEEEGCDGRVVATGSIQAGQVVFELTKFTTDEDIENAGRCRIAVYDVLVTMDGEGSIGKAAVFEDDYPAVPDSHVGILRFSSADIAFAVSCFLNSSLGQAQFLSSTTGATGQTQISRADLLGIQIPRSVLTNASGLALGYRNKLRVYESPIKRTRRTMCKAASVNTATLLSSDAFDIHASRWLTTMQDEEKLLRLLSILVPAMF